MLFAGDAGGFVNAITAEGIYYAMVSGELAGAAAATCGLDANSQAPKAQPRASTAVRPASVMGRTYDRFWRREIGAELSDAVLIQRYLFANHDRVSRAVRGRSVGEWADDDDVGLHQRDLSYSTLRRRMLWRFPMTILRMAREKLATRALVTRVAHATASRT